MQQVGDVYKINDKGLVLNVLVRPNAAASKIEGLHDGLLKLRINAQPVDGAANQAVIKLLSKTLNVPKTSIEILTGHTNKQKRLQLHVGAEKTAAVKQLLDEITAVNPKA